MRRRRTLLLIGAVLFTAAGSAGCSRSPASPPYPERIATHRAAKDELLGGAPDSPVLPEDRSEFLPLPYFSIDQSYAVPAVLAPSEREPAMEMATSTGLRRLMRRAGTLKFSLKGQPLQLTAFVEADAPDMNRLFLPFGDLTNGTETYAAGRYLDLDRSPTGLYEIDFNLAYHPYCYYNPKYDCPYPPPENRLPLPVRAGERMRKAGG
jgi:uncharacterized protein (DUF1684 family)